MHAPEWDTHDLLQDLTTSLPSWGSLSLPSLCGRTSHWYPRFLPKHPGVGPDKTRLAMIESPEHAYMLGPTLPAGSPGTCGSLLECCQELPFRATPTPGAQVEVLCRLPDLLAPAVSPWPQPKAYFLHREPGASGVTSVGDTSAVRYLLSEQMSE